MAATIGWVFLGAVAIALVTNGAFMLISPRAWLRLPAWFPSAGTSFRERYGSEKALIGIRMTGAAFLVAIAWVVYDYFSR
jgi:hypothetical protein